MVDQRKLSAAEKERNDTHNALAVLECELNALTEGTPAWGAKKSEIELQKQKYDNAVKAVLKVRGT